MQWRSRKCIQKFEEWCDNVPSAEGVEPYNPTDDLESNRYPTEIRRTKSAEKKFREFLIERLRNDQPASIKLESFSPSQPFELDLSTIEKECGKTLDYHVLVFSCDATTVIMRKVNVGTINSGSKRLRIENCKVGKLCLASGGDIEIIRSRVGTVTFPANRPCGSLKVVRTRIQNIEAFHSKEARNVQGSVEFRAVKFETSQTKSELFDGPQGFRNLRIRLEELENSPAANIMRMHELRAERPNDPYLTRFIGWCYDKAANYGTNTTKPVVILVVLWVLAAALVWHFDGGSTPLPDEQYAGWRAILTDFSGGRCARSIYLVIQSTFDPLGIIGPRRLVVAATGAIHLGLMLHGIVTFGLVLMTAFGIRKRFKLH